MLKLSYKYTYKWIGKVVARSYLYQTTAPSADTEVTYSPKDGKIRKAVGYGQSSSTQVKLFEHGNKHVKEKKKKDQPYSVSSYNLKYGNGGDYQNQGKETGNDTNGNGINLGANLHGNEPISPLSPGMSKTPLPIIGGRLFTRIEMRMINTISSMTAWNYELYLFSHVYMFTYVYLGYLCYEINLFMKFHHNGKKWMGHFCIIIKIGCI